MKELECHSPDPLLSVVVVMVGDTVKPRVDTTDLAGTLDALMAQVDAPLLEIIVPYHSRVEGIDAQKRQYPTARFLPFEPTTWPRTGASREHHDEMRAYGVKHARGRIIACLEDHVRPDARWSAEVLAGHQAPYAAIGGAVENEVDRPLNWAAYFCDLGKYQNPLREGASPFASAVNVSYKRASLESIESAWHSSFNETRVHAALQARGATLGLNPRILVHQHRNQLELGTVLQEFVVWGRSYSMTRAKQVGARQRLRLILLSPLLPLVLLGRMAIRPFQKKRLIRAFLQALPWTIVLTAAWSWGEWTGYISSFEKGSLQTRPGNDERVTAASASGEEPGA